MSLHFFSIQYVPVNFGLYLHFTKISKPKFNLLFCFYWMYKLKILIVNKFLRFYVYY